MTELSKEEKKRLKRAFRLNVRMQNQEAPYTWDIFPEELLYLRMSIERFNNFAQRNDNRMAEYIMTMPDDEYAYLRTIADRLNGPDYEKLTEWLDNHDVVIYDLACDVDYFLEMMYNLFPEW